MPRLSFVRALLALPILLSLAACQTADLSRVDLAAGLVPPSKAPRLTADEGVLGTRVPSAIVVDQDRGTVLYADDADGLRHPASTTKLMTLLLLLEAIDAKKVTMDTPLAVSAHAASRPPSKLGLRPGSTIRVRDALPGLAVHSSNDVASVVAENLGGTEERFALQMTARARQLGMTRTNFANASGLPDERQISTARDLAVLGLHIRKRFPGMRPLFAQEGFDYNGRHYRATNKLLGRVAGVDGMKTGYVNASGYNLVASARRGGRGVVVVVLGGQTGRARDARVENLIDTYLGPNGVGGSPAPALVAAA
ncbi:D-alanyl-D-alanine carboxypeptidase family protein, partial [Aureimonas sp. AU4]|uniref:D-alanyl-D-alanine carboxypeptidase family protein n=1 Tax=Aureimonas sp. AU4 TaxID=1638163 RepID=UPI000B173461